MFENTLFYILCSKLQVLYTRIVLWAGHGTTILPVVVVEASPAAPFGASS